jgi:NAD(P)-dependent dehydrogenase (short-subunit alcohol dehydrogenase family)
MSSSTAIRGLNGQIAIVTGGASGIGLAAATALRAEGAQVLSWDTHADADVCCDVSDPASVAAAMRQTISAAGTATLLVASAGINAGGPITDLDVADWDRVFAVNARGVFLAVQAFARQLIAAGQEGSAVIIGSVNGQVADPGTAAYGAAKAAAMHFAKIAARELGAHGIRVNVVGPGPTDTPMMADTQKIPGYRAEIAANTPLGRMGTPEDIAEAVVGVLQMGWVTGQIVMADGGSALCTARGSSVGARAAARTAAAAS